MDKKCLQEATWCAVFSGEAIKQRQSQLPLGEKVTPISSGSPGCKSFLRDKKKY